MQTLKKRTSERNPAHIGGAFLLPCVLTRCRVFILPGCNTAPYKRLQRVLYRPCNLYHLRRKSVYRALQGLFLRLRPLNRPRYQTDTTSHRTTRATLERIHAPGRPQLIPDTTAAPGRCTGQHRPPIIIRYIRRCRGAPLSWIHDRRCSISQTMPTRRRLDASHVRRLALWHRVSD